MVAPLLVLRHRAGSGQTSPAVFTMTGTSLTKIGDDISASLEPDSDKVMGTNRVINVFGSLYATLEDGLYKLQTGSRAGEWSRAVIDGGLLFTAPNPVSNLDSSIWGPFYAAISNVPYIYGVYSGSAANTWVGWKLNLLTDASTFTAAVTPSPTVAGSAFGNSIDYNGILVALADATAGPDALTFNPATMTFGSVNISGSDLNTAQVGSLDIFNGNLYLLGRAVANNPAIWRFENGAFNKLLDIDVGAVMNGNSENRSVLFNDGTSLYAIWYDTNGTPDLQWKIHQMDEISGALSVTSDLTSVVMPASLQQDASRGSLVTSRWWAFQNQLTTATPEILLYYSRGGEHDAMFSQYLFINNASELLLEDTGGITAGFAVPNIRTGGGDRIFISETTTTLAVYANERVSGGEKITFRAFGGATNQIVRFFFNTEGEVAETQATLADTATGGSAVRNVNQLDSVDADGITDYTITIASVGFNDFDRINLVAKISVS